MRVTAIRTSVRAVIALTCAGVLTIAAATAAVAEGAGTPSVGACYSITDAQAIADWWPIAAAVPCASPHTFEVTHVGPTPADVDALKYAEEQCTPETVWRDLGVNQATGGVIANPLRLQIVYFAVRSAPGDWACGISGWAFHGSRPETIEPMTGTWAEQAPEQREQWRMCSSAANGRSATAPSITVACTSTPRWQVTRWIQWDAIVRVYPGSSALTARAKRLCGPKAVFEVPTAKEWQAGRRSTFCERKYA